MVRVGMGIVRGKGKERGGAAAGNGKRYKNEMGAVAGGEVASGEGRHGYGERERGKERWGGAAGNAKRYKNEILYIYVCVCVCVCVFKKKKKKRKWEVRLVGDSGDEV